MSKYSFNTYLMYNLLSLRERRWGDISEAVKETIILAGVTPPVGGADLTCVTRVERADILRQLESIDGEW